MHSKGLPALETCPQWARVACLVTDSCFTYIGINVPTGHRPHPEKVIHHIDDLTSLGTSF